jgi:hypothetical protein
MEVAARAADLQSDRSPRALVASAVATRSGGTRPAVWEAWVDNIDRHYGISSVSKTVTDTLRRWITRGGTGS